MSYQSDIYEAIKASAPLTALIGDRFFWDVADSSTTTPYIVAQTVSNDGETDFDGFRDVSFPLIQFSAWAKTKQDAIEIMSKFRTGLEGRNLPGASDVSLSFAGEQSTRDPVTKLYGEIIDYRASTNTN
ncbi:DUF3168 domain-containing protein [Luteolibacter yonseiensis]|uniref:DUF3168 domain-containing protein n=1 Tax=Luteolibacter yonseiensis TaxID=1144680 RepID=A0A934VC24_9BACT|nr:DUF3168 domain-containing protein [Luteolibacter yonseiensis]MBK1816531.1 DUF3168 domain-containing protein [Luteolibacter yonseiensis]